MNYLKKVKNYFGKAPVNAKLFIKDLDDEIKFMEKKITAINGKIEYAENISSEELKVPPEFLKDEELAFVSQELEHLKTNKTLIDKDKLLKDLKVLQDNELELDIEINNLNKELALGKKVYQAMREDSEACCPTCKQKLNDESKRNATKQYRDELITKFNKQNKLKEKADKLHFETNVIKGKLYSLENSTEVITPETIKQLEANITMLQKEKQENVRLHNEYSAKLQTIKKAKHDIAIFNKDISELNKAIQETKKQCEIAKQLYFNTIKAKMSLIDAHLKDVKIRFYKVIKNSGEIKDDFVITYKGKDFSTLSRSEKVAASLEIANMFNKITGLDCPLFIDDSESYPDFDFLNTYSDSQIFVAQVKKGRNLKITSKNESIKGYKSNKNYTQKQKLKNVTSYVA